MTATEEGLRYGIISAIKGSIIEVKGIEDQVRLHDLVKISNHNILSEVIQIYPDYVVTQCLENTTNLRLNEKVLSLHEPLSMELGPGLLANVFDGIQRPLEITFKNFEDGKLGSGVEFSPLSRTKKWHFNPIKKLGITHTTF